MTTIRNTPAFQEIEDQKSHEKQEDIEVFPYSPYKYTEETKELWTTVDGERALELEIEEFLANLYPNPLCKIQMFEDMINKNMQENNTDEKIIK